MTTKTKTPAAHAIFRADMESAGYVVTPAFRSHTGKYEGPAVFLPGYQVDEVKQLTSLALEWEWVSGSHAAVYPRTEGEMG